MNCYYRSIQKFLEESKDFQLPKPGHTVTYANTQKNADRIKEFHWVDYFHDHPAAVQTALRQRVKDEYGESFIPTVIMSMGSEGAKIMIGISEIDTPQK